MHHETHDSHENLRKTIAPYEKARLKRSVWQLVNTIVPFIALWYLAYLSLSVSYLLALPFMVVASGFLIRIFIICHDCCHRSFFKSRLANEIVGTITGILTSVPYHQWRHTHSVHHATSSNLDKRGMGDVWTLTVDEYLSSSPLRRLIYRIYRHPITMFGIGPIFIFLVDYRFNRKKAGIRERINTYITNVGIFGGAALLCWLVGWQNFAMLQGPIFFLSGATGIWLFYVQHQFENSYFENDEEWSYVQAAMDGSSFYKLPKILQWITGNIGFHHIHHLSPRVPNYNLQEVHHNNPILQKVGTITLLSSLRSLRFRVWNEKTKEFMSFKDLRKFRKISTDVLQEPRVSVDKM
jgi:omega-6 fatty acid desaturase (delta-12 desaturase)